MAWGLLLSWYAYHMGWSAESPFLIHVLVWLRIHLAAMLCLVQCTSCTGYVPACVTIQICGQLLAEPCTGGITHICSTRDHTGGEIALQQNNDHRYSSSRKACVDEPGTRWLSRTSKTYYISKILVQAHYSSANRL